MLCLAFKLHFMPTLFQGMLAFEVRPPANPTQKQDE
jgi:hypothetical protein